GLDDAHEAGRRMPVTMPVTSIALVLALGAHEVPRTPEPMWFGLNTELAVPANLPARAGFAGALARTGARAIRYPGGSPASFWEWESGRFVPVEEIRRIWKEAWFQWEQAPGVDRLPP